MLAHAVRQSAGRRGLVRGQSAGRRGLVRGQSAGGRGLVRGQRAAYWGTAKWQEQEIAAKRAASSLGSVPASSEREMKLIYEGPMNGVVKRIKLVSLTTLSSSLLMPAMALAFGSSESVSLMGKVAVGGTACFAGVGSTAALHWCTLPFVFELRTDGARVQATRMNLLAQRTTHDFAVADVERHPQTWRPFVSFEAKGVPFFLTKSGFLDEGDAATYGAE